MKQCYILFLLLPFGLQACNPNSTSSARARSSASRTTTTEVPTGQIEATKDTKVKIPTTTKSPPTTDCALEVCKENLKFPVKTYLHIIVSGLPFQRGESHGRQAKEKILSLISYYKTSSSMPPWDECVQFVRAHYVKALEYYYPNGLEEMKGIANGAGVHWEDILILNARYELSQWKIKESSSSDSLVARKGISSSDIGKCAIRYPTTTDQIATNFSTSAEIIDDNDNSPEEDCTGAAALAGSTKYGHVLLGHNWSANEAVLRNETVILLEVHPDPCERIKPFVVLTEAGQLGKSGMNEDGFGIVGVSLWNSADKIHNDETSKGEGLVPMSLLHRMFLEAPNFSLGLRILLSTPRHVSANMIIATGENEALHVELTPNSHFITQVPLERQFLARSNQFRSVAFVGQGMNIDEPRASSSFRGRRVERHLMTAWPRINEYTFQLAFRDHVGHPNSVCEHSVSDEQAWTSISPRQTTVASIIFNLSQRTLQLCKGPPCICTYKEYRFKFSEL